MYEDPFGKYSERLIKKLEDAKKAVEIMTDAVSFHHRDETDLFDTTQKKYDAFIFCMSCLNKEISEEFLMSGQDFYFSVSKEEKEEES